MNLWSRCRCSELTGGLCGSCAPLRSPVPSVTLVLPIAGVEERLRKEMSDILVKFAEQEAGPVGIRLRQIASVFRDGGRPDGGLC